MAKLSPAQRRVLVAACEDRLWYSQATNGFNSRYTLGARPYGDTVPRPTIKVLAKAGLIHDLTTTQRMGGPFRTLISPTEKGRLEVRS